MRQNMPRMSLLDVDVNVDAEADAAAAAAEDVSNLSTHNGSNLMCVRVCVCVGTGKSARRQAWSGQFLAYPC